MMKFFRKYTKHLLVIFMSLLLVVWLGGSALTDALAGGDRGADDVVGTAYGKEVINRDRNVASAEMEVLNRVMGGMWRMPWITVLSGLGVNDGRVIGQTAGRIRQEPLAEHEWFLLRLAANESGVYVPPEAIAQLRAEMGITPEILARIRSEFRISPEQLDQALQSFLLVQEHALMEARAVEVSEADVQSFVRDVAEEIQCVFLRVDATPFIQDDWEPGDEELAAQFQEYKDVASRPASGLEFGYQLPEAAQVQYIRIAVDPLIANQTVTDDEAYAYWKANTQQFLKPSTRPAPAGDEPPPPPENREPFETFTQAKPDVVDYLKEQAAGREAARIANELIDMLGHDWADQPTTQPGDYRVPPASAEAMDLYQQTVANLAERYPGVLAAGETGLLDANGWRREAELGGLMGMPGTQQQIDLPRAAFLVAGLEADKEEMPDQARYFRNVYETCAVPFEDRDGNRYIIRTVATRPRQAPPSWQDIREKLIRDLRLERAYQQAGEKAQALLERAREVGLQKAFTENPELVAKIKASALVDDVRPFPRKRVYSFGGPPFVMPASPPKMPRDPELTDTCFALANETSPHPFAVALEESRENRTWILVEFVKLYEPTEALYAKHKPDALTYYRHERWAEVLGKWFDKDQIEARVKWEAVARSEEPADEDAEGKEGDEAAKQES